MVSADDRQVPARRPGRHAAPAAQRADSGAGGTVARLLRNPLYRSGYALVANAAGTTVVGVIYWVLAARLYPQAAVGRASAMVSALMLVSNLAQLNLATTLPRFVPEARRRAGRLIAASYAASSLAALAGGTFFVTVLPLLNQQWEFLAASPLLAIGFIVSAVAWGIFALQDAALVGLGRATVVPVENTGYGVAKLLLLAAAAAAFPAAGIFLSWVAPLLLVIPVINWLVFRRYLDRGEHAGSGSLVRGGQVLRYASVDYLSQIFSQAYNSLPPILVLSVLGPVAAGYFYIAWTIGGGLTIIADNFTTSLLVEGTAAPNRLARLTRGVLLRCLVITVPGALVLIAARSLVLEVYGAAYAASAAALLALFALASVPRSVFLIVASLDRIARRPGRVAWSQAALAAAVLGGSWAGLHRFGIDGVGYAWLAGNTALALVRSPTLIGAMRSRRGRSGRQRRGAPAADGRPSRLRPRRAPKPAAGRGQQVPGPAGQERPRIVAGREGP